MGEELRDMRVKAGMSAESAARQLGWSLHKLTGLELGEPGVDDLEVVWFATLFQARSAEIRRLVHANRESGSDTWLQPLHDDPALRVRTPLHEESRATAITGYHPVLVPAPLRTSAYSQAMCGVDQPAERHENLGSVEAVFYLDENVLKRTVGSPEVMRDQITHLLSCKAVIRIIPFDSTVACEGFTILDNPQGRPVVHLEMTVANLFLESPEHVAVYRKVIADLGSVTRDVETSRKLLLARV